MPMTRPSRVRPYVSTTTLLVPGSDTMSEPPSGEVAPSPARPTVDSVVVIPASGLMATIAIPQTGFAIPSGLAPQRVSVYVKIVIEYPAAKESANRLLQAADQHHRDIAAVAERVGREMDIRTPAPTLTTIPVFPHVLLQG